MVKTRAPMLSLSAQGTIAGAVTYSSWKGRSYARQRVDPSQPRTGGQVGRRSMFAFLTQIWDSLSTADKATWQTLADQLVTAPFHAFLSGNMEGWHNFLPPSQQPEPGRADTPSDGTLTAAAWVDNRIRLTWDVSSLDDAWGAVFFASLTNAFTPAVGNAIIVVRELAATVYDYFWTPPSVATWYFNSRAFSIDGAIAAAGGQQSAAPP